MPIGELKINDKDAYMEWGISLEKSSLSALMTPPPLKAFIENKSRLDDGKQIVNHEPKWDERTLTFVLNLTARDEKQFFARYAGFCQELKKGYLTIETSYQPGVVYHTLYQSCNQFTQFMRGIAKFTLKLCEPNPAIRKMD